MLGKGVVGGGGGTKAPKPSFVSYVRPEEIHTNEKEVTEKEVTLHLLPGEQLLCQASTVLKYVQEDSCQRGVCGRLVCTDFKIAFLGDDESALDNGETQFKNKVIGENDITLHCVDQIYGVFDEKKKSLFGQLKKYPEKLIIHCKDLRVFHFCLRYTKEEEVKRIVSGIIHYIQSPKLLKRLFLFSYATAAQNNTAADPKNHTVMFDILKDWCWELERTKGNVKYKAVSVNEGYRISERLPAYFVVPIPLPEEDVQRFQGQGIPIWCWSCHNGSALLKMSALPKEQDDGVLQSQKSFLDGIYKIIHRPPYEIVKTEDLSNNFISLQEIQTAYSKFKQLFLIDNSAEFWDTDIKWFSLLESSSWLDIIRRCLKKAIEIIECLEAQNMNILLLEENASDLCCLLSSLVQVMMDPHCRTKTGFQSLIQKEWVMGGHCFLDRCNHLRQSDKEEVPVFLLFLDCVWQLVHQHSPAFEFTETYLTVLSDSLYIPIFSTFFFNSPHQKDTNMGRESPDAQSKPLNLLTVWDWSVQFEPKAQTLLKNPLYVEKSKLDKGQQKGMRFKVDTLPVHLIKLLREFPHPEWFSGCFQLGQHSSLNCIPGPSLNFILSTDKGLSVSSAQEEFFLDRQAKRSHSVKTKNQAAHANLELGSLGFTNLWDHRHTPLLGSTHISSSCFSHCILVEICSNVEVEPCCILTWLLRGPYSESNSLFTSVSTLGSPALSCLNRSLLPLPSPKCAWTSPVYNRALFLHPQSQEGVSKYIFMGSHSYLAESD